MVSAIAEKRELLAWSVRTRMISWNQDENSTSPYEMGIPNEQGRTSLLTTY